MGCVQKKSSQSFAHLDLQFRNREKQAKTMLSTSTRPDFQTLFKQNLIQDLIRNRESQEATLTSFKKQKKPKFLSPEQNEMKKLNNTNQRKIIKLVSVSAGDLQEQ